MNPVIRVPVARDGIVTTSPASILPTTGLPRPEGVDLDACTVRVTRQLYYQEASYSWATTASVPR